MIYLSDMQLVGLFLIGTIVSVGGAAVLVYFINRWQK